jgi:UDP-N-acetylglucosamine 1-carboxyvinyltransferase
MEKFRIIGPTRLDGSVRIDGAKNAALKLMAASILTDDKITISNVPQISDVFTMAAVLKTLGKKVDFENGTMNIGASGKLSYEAPYELVSKMRASISVLGPLLAKLGKARVAMPGGCNIGSRKLDIHIKGLEAFGAHIESEKGYIVAKAPKLVGTEIILDFPSVGATENLLMAAVLAKGGSILENVAREPEISDLAKFLNLMGAKISGIGSSRLEIQGVDSLSGVDYRVVPDRIEAGTFMIAAAITGGDLKIHEAETQHLELVINKLREMGANIDEIKNGLRIHVDRRLKAVDIVTLPYPGFPTDLQAQILALLSLAEGTSILTENVFENRFMAVDELNRMGTDIRTEGHHAVVRGVKSISGVPVTARDLRGGAALVLAGLVAQGVTEVLDVSHIDRGYNRLEKKLNSLGAQISRISASDAEREAV